MSTQEPPLNPPPAGVASESWLLTLARRRRQTANALYAVAAVLLIGMTAWLIWRKLDYFGVSLWLGCLGVTALVGGLLWQLWWDPQTPAGADDARFFVLALGGAAGLGTTVILGLGLAWKWWDTITGGWEKWQAKDGWQLWILALAVFGGLAMMFVSLQMSQTDARSNPLLRRLLYGYNAVLTGLLLLAILTVFNVLCYTQWSVFKYLNKNYPWTMASIHALSSKSESILTHLDKPLHVYVILPNNEGFMMRAVRALMENCRAVSSRMTVEYLSPDLDQERLSRLAKDFKFADRRGLLIVFGSEPNVSTRFIKADDLINQEFDPNKTPLFNGEVALMNELNSLAQGADKPIIYFTQGQGELKLGDFGANRINEGIGNFKQKLETNNYQVKGLEFSPLAGVASDKPDMVISTKVPDDAAIVVIAGPKDQFQDVALNALRDYVHPKEPDKKKGKLLVLLDVGPADPKLQSFLAEYGVQVGNNRILHLPTNLIQNPTAVLVMGAPTEEGGGKNPVAAAFAGEAMILYGVRTVEPAAKNVQTPTLGTETLLIAPRRQLLWAETNLETDPIELMEELDRRKQLQAKLSSKALSVAVAVAENKPGNPADPHAFMKAEQQPLMIVIGDASLASNRVIADRSGGLAYDFLSSCLSWLGEKKGGIGIEPKKSDTYVLKPNTNVLRMVFLPGILMFVGIIGLGTGVWVVRRK